MIAQDISTTMPCRNLLDHRLQFIWTDTLDTPKFNVLPKSPASGQGQPTDMRHPGLIY